MQLAVLYFLNFYVLAITAASVGKLNGVSGNVKLIEFDLESNAFITTNLDLTERLYKLDSRNQVVFTKDFTSVVDLKFNNKSDVYIFEQVDLETRNVYVLNSNSVDIANVFNYSASSNLTAFFDQEDNLFLDTNDGLAVVRNGANVISLIPRLIGYHLKTKSSYDVDTNGNVFLELVRSNPSSTRSLILENAEIIKSDPRPYYLNIIEIFGGIQGQKLLNDSLYLCQDEAITKYKSDLLSLIYQRRQSGPCDFYVENNRIFVRVIEKNFKCSVLEIKSNGTLVDTGISSFTSENFCNIRQTSDKYGTVYFSTSDVGGHIQYIKVNDNAKYIDIPNSLFIFGLTTSEDGGLWILAQDLYYVPFGQTAAQKIKGLPYAEKPWPFKAKPGTNDVFIGSDDGVFIGTS